MHIGQSSSRRLPEGAATVVEAMTEGNAIDTREQQQHLDNVISIAEQWWLFLTP